MVALFLSDGIESLVQCQGIGALSPSTVLVGWPADPTRSEQFGAALRTIAGLGRNIVAIRFCDDPQDHWEAPPGTMDVGWRGHQNAELMLLLAYLLTRNNERRERPIRSLRVIENEAGREGVPQHMQELIEQARSNATPEVVVRDDPRDVIGRTSRDAVMVLIGFEVPVEGDELRFYERMSQWAGQLPRVAFVDSVGGMSLDS